MDAETIQRHLDDVFDQAIIHHGFTDYMRDYEIVVYCTADPSTGIAPANVQLLFKHCVTAEASTALSPESWSVSMDDRLLDHAAAADLDGYVWGVRWQCMYPGASLVEDSERAARWTEAVGVPFVEARIETNGHHLTLVFADLKVDDVPPGYTPFTVGEGGPDFKYPLT